MPPLSPVPLPPAPCHSLPLPAPPLLPWPLPPPAPPPPSPLEILSTYVSPDLEYTPGTRQSYCSTNYIILGLVLAAHSGDGTSWTACVINIRYCVFIVYVYILYIG